MTRAAKLRVAAGLTFAVGLTLWTGKLLDPHPVPDGVKVALGFWEHLPFVAAKCLHLSGYAFLTVAGQLAVPRRYWGVVAALMVAHGVATEVGQTYVPNRDGNVRDVAIDAAGVAAGTLLLRRVSRGRPAAEPQ